MRYTEYHCGVAVIKDRTLLRDAMEKLAEYENREDRKAQTEQSKPDFPVLTNNDKRKEFLKAKHKGTIFTKLKDGTISDKSNFYKDQKTEEIKEYLTKSEKSWLIIFWVFWIVVIVACVIGFYYFENDWLEE